MKKKLTSFAIMITALFSCTTTCFAADVNASTAKSWSNFFDYLAQCPVAIVMAAFSAAVVILPIIFKKPLAKKLNNSTATHMIRAFIAISAIFSISSFIMALLSDGVTLGHMLHSENTNTAETFHFFDYLNTLRDAGSKNFIRSASEFSPMALLIFYILAQFMPTKYIHSAGFATLIQMSKNQTFIYCYLIILMMLIVLIYRVNRNVLRRNGRRFLNEIVAYLLVVSYPTLYCIKLGNIVGLSYALVMFFIAFRDSEKRAAREFSLLALAISAAITPYTLIFALLLISKGKKVPADFIKTLVYSVVLFVAPAIFTGFDCLGMYISNLFRLPEETPIENLAISGILRFAGIENTVLLYVIPAVFWIIALACIIILPSAWQKAAAAVYLIVNLVPAEPNAILLLVFIPLILLLAEQQHKATDWIYLAAFTLLVSPLPEWFWFDGQDFSAMFESIEIYTVHNANELVAPFAVQLIFVLIVCQTIATLVKNKKQTKEITE